MKIIGITGGVGSGKSEILNILKNDYQAKVIQSDHVAHELMVPGAKSYDAIVQAFGNEILNEDQTINRPILGEIVFRDETKLSLLNSITHKNVDEEILSRIDQFGKEEPEGLLVIESALLVGAGYEKRFDQLWYIYTREEVRYERLKASRGYSDEKIKQMIEKNIITPQQAKVGYVAAFPLPEVISGYTAFYLGVQSMVPEATMIVKYTNTWSSYSLEKQAANELIDENCVVISQHSDTIGPATACENAKLEIPVYHVGYNQSMTDIAPTKSLISCCVDYSYYFEQSIGALLHDKKIEDCIDGRTYGQDAMAGLDKGWVRILDLNETVAPSGTKEMVEDTIDKLSKGELEVFSGSFTGVSVFDPNDRIDLNSPYKENDQSSSPTFCYILDDVISMEEMNEK